MKKMILDVMVSNILRFIRKNVVENNSEAIIKKRTTRFCCAKLRRNTVMVMRYISKIDIKSKEKLRV